MNGAEIHIIPNALAQPLHSKQRNHCASGEQTKQKQHPSSGWTALFARLARQLHTVWR
jgi:hypothetical protein